MALLNETLNKMAQDSHKKGENFAPTGDYTVEGIELVNHEPKGGEPFEMAAVLVKAKKGGLTFKIKCFSSFTSAFAKDGKVQLGTGQEIRLSKVEGEPFPKWSSLSVPNEANVLNF